MSNELSREQIEEYREWLGKEPKNARGFTGRLICDMALAHLADGQCGEDAKRRYENDLLGRVDSLFETAKKEKQ